MFTHFVKMKRSKTVEEYLENNEQWLSKMQEIRSLMLSTNLEECIKWGIPCYTFNNKNVVGFAAFKEHLAIWFYQGVFLKDEAGILINAQEGVTKGMRQIRFKAGDRINKALLTKYIREAIENQNNGLEIKIERNKTFEIPVILSDQFEKEKALKEAFERLTFGKQKEFALYVNEAKQYTTQIKRIDKIRPLVMQGVGLNDKYKLG